MSVEIPEIEPPKPRKFLKKPDVEKKNSAIKELDAQIKKIEAQVAIISADIEKTVTPKADSEKRNALTTELKSIIKGQNEIKDKRHLINDQIKLLDQTIKKKVAEINSKTSKYNFSNVESIDKKISEIESKVEAGNMMLVEEKRAMKEISSLNKLKKDFAGIAETQKSIDNDKAKIATLKQSLNELSNKEIQTKFEAITAELDELSKKNKTVHTKRDELFNKRRALNDEKFKLLKEIRKIRDDFDAKFKKFKADMDNERKKREEEERAYTLYLEKKDLLDEIKDIEASSTGSVFGEDISNIKVAIESLKPSTSSSESASTSNEDVKLPENAEIIKKEVESFVSGNKGKKYKKKNQNKNEIDSSIITKLTLVGVKLPANKEDIPETISVLENKLKELEAKEEEALAKVKADAEAKINAIKEQISGLDKQILEELEKKKEREAAPATEVEEAASEATEA